jgi:hypothetical protein
MNASRGLIIDLGLQSGLLGALVVTWPELLHNWRDNSLYRYVLVHTR